jgi:outer membrane receptor protein involved in Fe transport
MSISVKRLALMAGAAAAALLTGLASTEASAQSADRSTTSDSTQVVVTGTRIHRPNLKSNSPITSVDSKEIQIQGVTAIETVLNRLPQVTADANENVSNGSDGTANVNLRGLGSNRNLVLIDGQRMLPTLAVDLDFIPTAMVSRVDVLTGGASSVYGSDAISGVVNFVLNKHLNGVSFDSQYSIYQHTNDDSYLRGIQTAHGFAIAPSHVLDGEKYQLNLAVGSDLADHRGNVSAYIGYRSTQPVTQARRDYSACALNEGGTGFTCGGSGNNAYGRFIPLSGPNAGNDYDNAKDGSKTWVPNDSSFLYNYAPVNYIQRQDKRVTSGAFVTYKFNDMAEGYGSFMFMDDHTFSQAAPSAIFLGTNFAINCDNPLMGDQQKTLLCGSTTSTADANALVGYRAVTGPGRRDDLRHTDYRYSGGLRGRFNAAVTYDISATRSQMVLDENYQNNIDPKKAAKALEVVLVNGTPTCKSVIDGTDPSCVPIDIFSAKGPSKAGLQYLYAPQFTHGEQDLTQITGSVNADLGAYGVRSPWATDGLAAVFGFEHRVETLVFKADAVALSQGTQNADGSVKNDELFTELDLPLIQDRPFVKSLGINAGYRYTRYNSHSSTETSPQKTFSTWKIEGAYAPNDDIRFRISYNQAVRAPNISELFAAQSVGNVSGDDPCAGPAPSATLAQCQLSGVTAAEYGHITECPASTCDALGGGNPDLNPETAKTLTYGLVYTPKRIRNLQISADYFNIEVDNYISSVDPELIINECIANSNAFFCKLFHRDHNSGGILFGTNGYLISTNINTGFLKTAGVDLAGNYRLDIDRVGRLDFDFMGTWLQKLVNEPLPGFPSYDCKGQFGTTCGEPAPVWRHNLRTTWTMPNGVTTLSLNWRYFGKVDIDTKVDGTTSAMTPRIKAYTYIDLAGTWDVGHGVVLRGGINNLFDQSPPAIAAGLLASFGNGNTYPGVYDPMGRMFFVGLSAKY